MMTDLNIKHRKDLDFAALAREVCIVLRRFNLSRPKQIERIASNASIKCVKWFGTATEIAELAMPNHFDVGAPSYEECVKQIDDMSLLEYSHDCVYSLANEKGFRQRKEEKKYREAYENILHKYEIGELPKYTNSALKIEDKKNQEELKRTDEFYVMWLNDEFRNNALSMIPKHERKTVLEKFESWKFNREAKND